MLQQYETYPLMTSSFIQGTIGAVVISTVSLIIYLIKLKAYNKKYKYTKFFEASSDVSSLAFRPMTLVKKRYDTSSVDTPTVVLTFSLNCVKSSDIPQTETIKAKETLFNRRIKPTISGISPCQHVQIRALINGEIIQRSYSPTSHPLDEAKDGTMDLHVKVYLASLSDGVKEARSGGVMSNYLNALSIGDAVEMRGPTGRMRYIGKGAFEVSGVGGKNTKIVRGKHLVLMAGGSGVTPIVAILKAILHGKLGGKSLPSGMPEGENTDVSNNSFYTAADEINVNENQGPSTIQATNYTNCSYPLLERITLFYTNKTVDDILLKEWLQGTDTLHDCYGGFYGLNKNPDITPIDISLNYFITRPSDNDRTKMAADNAKWESYRVSDGRPTTVTATATATTAEQNIDVSQRYTESRITPEIIHECLKYGHPVSPGAVRESRYYKNGIKILAGDNDLVNETVAVLCGPKDFIEKTCKPALGTLGVTKVLLA